MNKRKLYYVSYEWNGYDISTHVLAYTMAGAVSLVREYLDLPAKAIHGALLATPLMVKNHPGSGVMVFTHMYIPMDSPAVQQALEN